MQTACPAQNMAHAWDVLMSAHLPPAGRQAAAVSLQHSLVSASTLLLQAAVVTDAVALSSTLHVHGAFAVILHKQGSVHMQWL